MQLRGTLLLALGATSLLSATALAGPPAESRGAQYALDIPAESLIDALQALALASHRKLLYTSELVDGKSSSALKGRFTAEEALKALLSGTALTYEATADGALLIRPAAVPPTSGPTTPEASDAVAALSEVIVTGTLIGRTDAVSANPVSVVTAATIKLSETSTLADLTRQLPAFGGQGYDGSPVGQQTGSAAIELRNLGVNRTLILVNGLRYTPSISFWGVAVDTNSIPVPLIDRVEVLRDGASPIYGSDAVAGVVNIITKRDFQGLRFDAGGGMSGLGDRAEQQYSITAGQNFEQGNIVANVRYLKRDGLEQGDRDYSRRPISQLPIKNPDGSFTNVYGGYFSPGGTTFLPTGQPVTFNSPTSFTALGPNLYEDSSANQTLLNPLEAYGATVQARYGIADSAELFAEGGYAHTDTIAFGSGAEFFPGRDLKYPGAGAVPADNPFNMFGVPIPLYREYSEVGQRSTQNRTETSRGVLGLRGSLFEKEHYQIFYAYGHSRNASYWNDQLNVANLVNSFDPVLCAGAPGCVVANPFGPGSISPAATNYIRNNDVMTNNYTQGIAGASLSGDLLALPAGPMSFATGGEYRRETGSTQYDAAIVNGDSSLTSAQPTRGSFDAGEAYAEVNSPLLKDLPAAAALSIDLAGRYSHYNRFGGASTWKAGLNWAITSDVRLRASHGTAFRAPTITEFAGGVLDSFTTYTDPCDTANGLTANPSVKAACAAAGLSASFRQLQSKTLGAVQGNGALQPEKAAETNIGIVLTPTVAPGLVLQLDYFRIQLTGAIFQPTAQQVADDCYLSGSALSSPDCARITRGAAGQIDQINLEKENIGTIRTDGLDLEAAYRFKLSDLGVTLPGEIHLSAAATYLNNFQQQSEPGAPLTQYAGTFDLEGQFGSYSRLKTVSSLSYSLGGFTGSYTLRYIRGSQAFNQDPTQVPANWLRQSDVYYHDLAANYVIHHIDVVAGVQNLLNRYPPLNGPEADLVTYDPVGRFFYVKLSVKL